MSQHAYPGLEEQRQEHDLFKQNITMLSEMMANNVPTNELAIRMDATLIRYFINHIRKLDSRLAGFIKSLKGND